MSIEPKWTKEPWLVVSTTVYALTDHTTVPRFVNKWSANFQPNNGINASPYEEIKANAVLASQAPRMAEEMQRFVDRVDAGEIRSKKTYAAFKEILAAARGEE